MVTPFRASWTSFAVLAFAVLAPAAMTVTKYLGSRALLPYYVGGCAALWVAARALPVLARQRRSVLILLATLAFGAIFVTFTVVYPRANLHTPGMGSDSDDALDQATRALLAGTYPYAERTYLGNPITPLPGSLLFAIPFVLLGASAYQFVLWLPVAFVLLSRLSASLASGFWLLGTTLLLSPIVMQGIVTGSDYLSNSIIVLTGMVLALASEGSGSSGWRRWLVLTFLGLGLATRANYAFLLPVFFGSVARKRGPRRAAMDSAGVCAVALLVTLPFYLADPPGFSPLHTIHKVEGVPYGRFLVPALDLVVALVAAWTTDGTVPSALRSAFVVLTVPVVLVAGTAVWHGDGWMSSGFGLLTMSFGLASYGVDFTRGARWPAPLHHRGGSGARGTSRTPEELTED